MEQVPVVGNRCESGVFPTLIISRKHRCRVLAQSPFIEKVEPLASMGKELSTGEAMSHPANSVNSDFTMNQNTVKLCIAKYI